jgi:hypothetical protein
MTSPDEYECYGYITLSPKLSGVLYPVYRHENLNVSFVQEGSRSQDIAAFLPFYDFDHVTFCDSLIYPRRVVGGPMLYAFNNANGIIQELTAAEIRQLVHGDSSLLFNHDLPVLTRLGLGRLAGASQLLQMDLVDEMAKTYFSSPVTQQLYKTTYFRNYDALPSIWAAVEAKEPSEDKEEETSSYNNLSTEDIIRQLYEMEYSAKFVAGMATLARRLAADERVLDLVVRMCNSDKFSLRTAERREKIIVARALELYSLLGRRAPDFEDMMYDLILDGSLFHIGDVVDIKIVIDFLEGVGTPGKERYDTEPVDVYLEVLREPDLSPPVARALIREVFDSDCLYEEFERPSIHHGKMRIDVLREVVLESPRLSLVLGEELDEALADALAQ